MLTIATRPSALAVTKTVKKIGDIRGASPSVSGVESLKLRIIPR
jgi:hypothetical protein